MTYRTLLGLLGYRTNPTEAFLRDNDQIITGINYPIMLLPHNAFTPCFIKRSQIRIVRQARFT